MVFHVERLVKSVIIKGAIVILLLGFVSCITPRHTVEINDYTLLRNGKQVLGKEKGLTAFVFENNKRRQPFNQFVADKYGVGNYVDVAYWVTIEDSRFKVMVYENAEIEKYFDTSVFMVTNVEPDSNIVGSKANFIAISVINESNEDCLSDDSLYRNMIIKYLKDLKDEYNS